MHDVTPLALAKPGTRLYKTTLMSSLNKRSVSYPEASLTLALSAAEGRLLMALGRIAPGGEAETLFAQDWQATAQGVELLAPALDSALRTLKLTPRHIGRVAAVNGPGSFTGLRLSIITASGLARAIGAAQAALPYLPLLAAQAAEHWAAFNSGEAPEFWAVTHARRGLVHAQGFRLPEHAAPQPASEVLALGLEEAAALLGGRSILAFGSGIGKNRDFFASALPAAHLPGPALEQLSPGFLLRAALALNAADYGEADITPLYVRASDAEENLAQISARLGLDPEAAAARLALILSAPPQGLE